MVQTGPVLRGWEAAVVAAMDGTSGGIGRGGDEKKAAASCDVEALRKCLEENKGDRVKCQAQIDAFRSSCSVSPTSSSSAASGVRFTVQKQG